VADSQFVVPNVPSASFCWSVVTGDATVLRSGMFTPPAELPAALVGVALITPSVSVAFE
jgi:hypothetical protein